MKHLALLFAICATIVGKAQGYNYGTYADEIFECLRLINEKRTELGLNPLEMDSVLFKAARYRCEEIGQKFSHTRPNGKDFTTVMTVRVSGNYWELAENIGKGYKTPKEMFDGFMDSRGHKKNMLSKEYDRVGICYNPIKQRWVQIFGAYDTKH